MTDTRISIAHRLQDAAARAVLGAARLLPYETRVPLVGWVVSRLVAPAAGWHRRIRENLGRIVPDLPPDEVERLVRQVPDNVGRTLIELYSGREFLSRVAGLTITGPGAAAIEEARAAGRPIILLTAHLGNYDAVRGMLAQSGHAMAALYKPMRNTLFNAHYLEAISEIGAPLFPTEPRGLAGLLRHLKDGGTVGIVADIAMMRSPLLTFFGRPAHTSLSAAEWALKYDAALIPMFGIREPDGLSFRIHAAAPIEPGTPEEMMQAYNDEVEAQIRSHMDQWLWIHRRWKIAS